MDEVQIATAHEERVRLLEDGDLYRSAITFVRAQHKIENKQLLGLLEYSRSWEELIRFVQHQKGRDWGEPGRGNKAHYREFYTALDNHLNQNIRSLVRSDTNFVPINLTKKDTDRLVNYFSGLLARSFIQHLVAEMLWQQEGQS